MATKKASTAVAVKSATNVVSIRESIRAQAFADAGRVAAPTGINIKVTQDKKFLLPDGTKTEGPLDLVIVEFASRNEYYEGAYDPNNVASPVCFAIHPNVKEMVPSANSPDKQCDDCASCPKNQFGSSGKGKACKNMRVMAVLPPGAGPDTPMWLLKVSPTAIKGFDSYITALQRLQMAPVEVLTSVDFNPAETYASLTFSDPRPLDDDEFANAAGRIQEAKDLLAIEPDTTRVAAPKPAVRAPARKPVGIRR